MVLRINRLPARLLWRYSFIDPSESSGRWWRYPDRPNHACEWRCCRFDSLVVVTEPMNFNTCLQKRIDILRYRRRLPTRFF
jgi:hypothetical protein